MSTKTEDTIASLSPKRAIGKCQYLLAGMLLMLLGSPIGDAIFYGEDRPNYILYATELVVIVGGLIALGDNRRHTILAIITVIPMVTTSVLAVTNDSIDTLHSGVSSFFFYSYLAFTLRRFLKTRAGVDTDAIYGIVASYLVIGLMFASVYSFIELWRPGAFYMDPTRFGDDVIYGDLVYFSFVTQTTLGYGDITPTNELAKSLAFLQATLGIFFLAIIVARFIAEYQANSDRPIGPSGRA